MKPICLLVKTLILSSPLLLIGALPSPSSAADTGTAAEARAMLEKAVVGLEGQQGRRAAGRELPRARSVAMIWS